MAEAVRQAGHAGHQARIAQHVGADLADARTHRDAAAILQTARAHVVGVHQQLVTRFALGQAWGVVHPRIVAAHLAAPDQAQAAIRDVGALASSEAVEFGQQRRRRAFDAAACGLQAREQGRLQRAEVQAMRRGLQRGKVQPAVATRQAHRDQVARPRQGAPLLARTGRVGGTQAVDDFPIGAFLIATPMQGAIEARHPAYREGIEDRVVMVLGQRRGRRQDQVRMAGGLVDVDVDRDHERQALQRLVQRASVRRGQHRIAGADEQGADLAVAGGGDLLDHAGHRQLAGELRQPAHAAVPTSVRAGVGARPGDRDRRLVRQRAADAVQVAAHQVHQLQQDLAQRAPGLH